MNPYGHSSAGRLLRGGRAEELLAGGRAPRCDPAGGQPADSLARAAARPAVARPLRAAGRADRGGTAAVCVGTTPAAAGGAAPGGGGLRPRGGRRRDAP